MFTFGPAFFSGTTLTANSALKLLLHFNGSDGSSSFTDSSSVAKTITILGTPTHSTSQAKFGLSSCTFSGGVVLTDNHTDFNVGAGNFTIELHVRLTSLTTCIIFNKAVDTSFFPYQIWYNSGAGRFNSRGFSTGESLIYSINAIAAPVINTWYHLALVRNGADITFYVNGVAQGTTDISTTALHHDGAAKVSIGAYSGSSFAVPGFVDEVRFLKGQAAYVSNFTPLDREFTIYD